jgi:hypothetical protein
VINEEGRLPGRPSGKSAAAKPHASVVQSTATDDTPALFESSEYIRGPGPAAATTGPEDAHAPAWWWAEAERVVLALVESGHRISSDDLHERFPDEPSASGAAFGGLFARLARAGRIVEVGMVKSRRPEARRRRIILWAAP